MHVLESGEVAGSEGKERWGMTCNKGPQPDSNQGWCEYMVSDINH